MRFTIEQVYLADPHRLLKPAGPEYHVVEADSVDAALHDFLARCSATAIGPVQKYPGFHAVVTARSGKRVFTIELSPGSDVFRRGKESDARRRP